MSRTDSYFDLTDEQLRMVDAVCEKHERSLRSDANVSITEQMENTPGNIQRRLFGELLAIELEFHRDRDGSPDIDEYLLRYRDHEDEVRRVFREYDSSTSPKGIDAVADSQAELIGSMIGPFKLRELIGEGGMGLVFIAEQVTPIRRKVALKIVKPGMDSKEVIARFEVERQALAMMDHPNIAQVFDAGVTEHGRPYFVMELIRGSPVTEFCDKHQLSTSSRLELFRQICLAVQHAHQKGIIHRDIKPTNILVSLDGDVPIPKVIDFGVAKAISQRLVERTVYTRMTQLIGTPIYMSPEQAEQSSEDVDTRTDIYSLGVVLYELLTGSTPFTKEQLSDVGYDEMRRIIREEEPVRPSQRISTLDVDTGSTVSRRRSTPQPKLAQMVRGELDWIVLKAMAKEVTRRYETAGDFAADIRRFLADEPVMACPPSLRYRLGKFARRNKIGIAAAMFVLVGLIGSVAGLAVSNRLIANQRNTAESERERADENFQKARVAVDRYFTLVSETTLLDEPGLQPLRTELIENAVEFYQSWTDRGDATPEVKIELAKIRLRLGVLYFRLTSGNKAIDEFDQAFDLIDQTLEQIPLDAPEFQKLSGFYGGLRRTPGMAPSLPSTSKFEASRSRGVKLWRRFASAHPDVPAFRRDLLGFDISEAEVRELMISFPEDRELMAHLAMAIFHNGRVREEPTTMREGIAKLIDADLPIYRDRLAGCYQDLGWNLMSHGKNAEAAVELQKSVDMFHELAREFPHIKNYDLRARAYTSDLAKALGNSDQIVAAVQLAEDVSPRTGNDFVLRGNIFKEIKQDDKAIADYEVALEFGLQGQIPSIRRVGEFFDKRKQYQKAIHFYDHDIQTTTTTPSVSRTYAQRGASRANLKEYGKALADFASSIEINAWDCEHHLTRMKPMMLRESPEAFQQAFLQLADRAIAITEGAAVSYVARAYVHQSLQRRDLAVADLSKAIEIEPEYKLPWTLRPLLREREANSAP